AGERRHGARAGRAGKLQRTLDVVAVRNVALDDGQFACVEPDQLAALARIDDGVAAPGVWVRLHPFVAARTFQHTLQLSGVERRRLLLVGRVPGAALFDDASERRDEREEAAAAAAVRDHLAVDQRRRQRQRADGAVAAGRLVGRADAVAGLLR